VPDQLAAMDLALDQARLALVHHDVPIGAVVLRGDDVIAARHNERELNASSRATRPRTRRSWRCVTPRARSGPGDSTAARSSSRSSRA
jgi:hypothetical protein